MRIPKEKVNDGEDEGRLDSPAYPRLLMQQKRIDP